MKRVLLPIGLVLLGITVSIAFSQPPGGGGPGGAGPGGAGPQFGMPPNPVLEALDADGDHEISAQEIQDAAASLKKIDKNGDGKLTHDEMHPPIPGGRPGFAPQVGREGLGQGRPQGPHAGGPGGLDMLRPAGPGAEGAGQGRPQGPHGGGPGGPGMHSPAGPGAEGPGQGRDHAGHGGPPSPEQFVEHAMQFDADQDGKLSKDELLKLAEQFMHGPQAGGRPGEHGGRPEVESTTRPRRPSFE